MKRTRRIPWRRLALALFLLAAAALATLALRPRPVPVELGRAVRGPLRTSIDEEGETRVRDRYVLGAPIAGRLERIGLDEGDPVAAGAVVARLDPAPLDPRGRQQAEARLSAAEATRREAAALVTRRRAALEEARRTLRRYERLAAEEVAPAGDLDAARTAERMAASDLEAALEGARAAAFEAESARAALVEAGPGAAEARPLELRSPVAGKVLRVCEECEKVGAAGTPLLELGDPGALEVVVDVLSDDAVAVRPGAPMRITAGGEEGRRVLDGRVRLVEPSGFTKVSPLGVEEQRVNVIGDFAAPPEGLGDRYRVEVEIVLWEAGDVLQVPAGALFRQGDGWAVFVVERGRARLRPVEVGHRGPLAAEIRRGLSPGEAVVLHPGDAVADGVEVV